jgi:hypothetical protein
LLLKYMWSCSCRLCKFTGGGWSWVLLGGWWSTGCRAHSPEKNTSVLSSRKPLFIKVNRLIKMRFQYKVIDAKEGI